MMLVFARAVSFWIGVALVYWCFLGPVEQVGPARIPLPLLLWLIWKMIDSRLDRICQLRRSVMVQRVTVRGFQRRATAMMDTWLRPR